MSAVNRFRVWVRYPRNYVLLAGASAGFVAIVEACPLLFPSKLYRPILEAYKGGKRSRPTEAQRREFEDVCKELGLETGPFHIFATSRWDLKVKGLPFLPSGVQFGIPVQFVDEPKLGSSKFAEGIRGKLNSEEGSSFRRSMKLSERARKFAMAREAVKSDKCYAAYPFLFAPAAVLAGFATTFAVQVTAGLFPLSATGFLVGSIFFCSYRYLTGVLNESHDLRTDVVVANLGPGYVEGGVEFYEKNLERNRALRKLLGGKGEKLYSYYGNVTPGVLWSDGAPMTSKRDHLRKVLMTRQSGKPQHEIAS